MGYKFILGVIIFLWVFPAYAHDKLEIENSQQCSHDIGAGGNLIGALHYEGKCEGNALSPRMKGDEIVQFRIKGNQVNSSDRSELAIVNKRLWPDKTYYITASINIPENNSDTDKFFYIMQLWQGGGLSPLAGIRLNGKSHQGMLMARDINNKSGDMIYNINFNPIKWYNFIIKIRIDKKNHGAIKLYNEDKQIASWQGNVGYFGEKGVKPFYRLKYGIYKGAEPGKEYQVNFKRVRIFEEKDKAVEYLTQP